MRVQGSRVDCCSDVGECRPRPHCHTPPSAPTSLKRSVIFCQMLNFVISGVVFFAKILGVICPENSLISFLSGPRLSAVHSVGFPGDFFIFSHFLGRFSYFLTFFSEGDFLIFLPFLREMSPLFISPSLAVWMKLVLFSPPAVFSCRRFRSLSIS